MVGLPLGLATPALAATDNLNVATTAQASTLVGGTTHFKVDVSNTTTTPAYNLTYRAVLPKGVTYKTGSTTLSSWGDPTIVTDQVTSQQTLIWSNVLDLAVQQASQLNFDVTSDPTIYPVGSTITLTGEAYSSSDPRLVPTADNNGVITDNYSATGSSSSTTTIASLTVKKTVPLEKGEWLRGVHDHTQVYTIEVENNSDNPTKNVQVIDYLPASLEFLGCGGIDNSSSLEYPS